MTILIIIFSLLLLCIIHEFGHFIVAKYFKVAVEAFSIGFGPKLLSFKKKETEYRLSLIPLGGYVKMKGENFSEETSFSENDFSFKKWWQKLLIVFCGPLANIILATIVMFLVFNYSKNYYDYPSTIGKIIASKHFLVNDKIIEINGNLINSWSQISKYINSDAQNDFVILRNDKKIKISINKSNFSTNFNQNIYPKISSEIGFVQELSPAFKTNLKAGDIITEINEIPIYNWYDIVENLKNKDEVNIKVIRMDTLLSKHLVLEKNLLSSQKIIGISPKYSEFYLKNSFWQNLNNTTNYIKNIILLNYYGIYKLIVNPTQIKENIGGPIMFFSLANKFAKENYLIYLKFFAYINIIVAIMNLLPIPVLDGGQIIFYLVEAVKGKPLSLKTQEKLQKIGFFIIIFIMFFSFYSDISRLINK